MWLFYFHLLNSSEKFFVAWNLFLSLVWKGLPSFKNCLWNLILLQLLIMTSHSSSWHFLRKSLEDSFAPWNRSILRKAKITDLGSLLKNRLPWTRPFFTNTEMISPAQFWFLKYIFSFSEIMRKLTVYWKILIFICYFVLMSLWLCFRVCINLVSLKTII